MPLRRPLKAKAHLTATQFSIQTRLDHYNRMIEQATADPQLGLNQEEADGLDCMLESKESQDSAGEAESKAQKLREIGPQWAVTGEANIGGGVFS